MGKAHCAQRAHRQEVPASTIEHLIEIDFSITRASLVYKPTQLQFGRAGGPYTPSDPVLRRKTLRGFRDGSLDERCSV